MTYEHRVKTSEVPTSLLPARDVDAAVSVVFGTAPIEDLAEKNINKPVLCYSYAEFVAAFGDSDDWAKYTLCEFADSHFGKFGVGPVVFINVYDPEVHKTGEVADPTVVDDADIIGGIDVTTGQAEGLELIEEVFPRFRLIPGLIVAPGFSTSTAVAITMAAKARGINSLFNALAIIDIDDTVTTKYTEVPGYKETNNLTDSLMVCCYGKVTLGDKTYHLSTQAAGRIALTDSENDGVPYVSPSNKRLYCDGATVDGKELFLSLPQAEYLNGNGIVVPFNFDGGWKLFGNRTACYPSNTDPKDAFISIRRFFNWHGNTFILTYWQLLDGPLGKRLVQTICDSEQVRLNGFTAREYILGGEIIFSADENPTTDLMDGKVRFHTFMTPPSPARVIENIMEYDVSNLANLFGGA
ncbi:MAG: hypothetical protein OCC45_08320 [Desulfotalea sp.]